jgi:hypothetical protein
MACPARLHFPLFTGVALLLSGCGGGSSSPGQGKTAKLYGVVLFADKTRVKVGQIVVVSEDGLQRAVGEILRDDGVYVVEKAPVGKVRIGITTPDPSTLLPPDPEAKPVPGSPPDPNAPSKEERAEMERRRKAYVPLPEKYADPRKSELSTTVEEDKENRHDIILKR